MRSVQQLTKSTVEVDISHPVRSSVFVSCLQDHVESGDVIDS